MKLSVTEERSRLPAVSYIIRSVKRMESRKKFAFLSHTHQSFFCNRANKKGGLNVRSGDAACTFSRSSRDAVPEHFFLLLLALYSSFLLLLLRVVHFGSQHRPRWFVPLAHDALFQRSPGPTHTHTHPSWSYPVVLCAALTKKEEKFLVALQAYPLHTIEFGSVYKSDQWTFLAESSISLSGARRRRSHKPKKFIEHFPVGLLHSHTHTVTFGERTGATSFTYL